MEKASKDPFRMNKSASRSQLPKKEPSHVNKSPKGYERIKDILQKDGELYKLVIENMQDILCTLDTKGRFTFVNEVLPKKTGHPRDWFMGRSCLEMVQPKNKNAVKKCIEAVLRGEPIPTFELAYKTTSGDIWVEFNATPLIYDNKLMGILVVCRDISDRKKIEEELELYRNNLEELIKTRTNELFEANKQLQHEIAEREKTEQALKNSELYYRTIFQNTGTAMIIMEEDTTISLSNRESLKFVGYPPEALKDKRKALEFVVKTDLQRLQEYSTLRAVDPDKAPKTYETKIVDRNGKTRGVLVNIARIPGTKKNIASFIDITDRQEMEAALKVSKKNTGTFLKMRERASFKPPLKAGF
jgi:PAS domain S-box-containing protein